MIAFVIQKRNGWINRWMDQEMLEGKMNDGQVKQVDEDNKGRTMTIR